MWTRSWANFEPVSMDVAINQFLISQRDRAMHLPLSTHKKSNPPFSE